jgi:hypothetical protein
MLAAGHETPVRLVVVAPVGAGVGWIDHVVPASLSAISGEPTVVQTPAEVHETPSRIVLTPAGGGSRV